MEILQKEDVISFIGNVELVQGKNKIIADRMKSFEKKGIVEGDGNVHFIGTTEEGEKLEIFGGKVVYNKNKDYGVITKNPKLIRKIENSPEEKPVTLICNKIEIYLDKEEIIAWGNVQISREGMKGQGEKGFYFHKAKKMTLTGNPQIFREDGKNESLYKADEIIILINDRKIFLEGNVTGTVIFEGKN